jgi:lysine-N-methylase
MEQTRSVFRFRRSKNPLSGTLYPRRGNKLYDADLQQCPTDPATQLATALELMVARLRLDYTSPRYMDLYGDFADGSQLKTDAAREERGSLYAEVYRRDYAPFMKQHDYMLENYLWHTRSRRCFRLDCRQFSRS